MDPLEQKRNGYSLVDCAEITAAHVALRTEHGEPGFTPHFQQFLRSRGLTEGQWAEVWNDWHQVMEADTELGAKYHGYLAQAQQRRMIAKQPNVSVESMEGLSLEQYAKISAQVQTGAAIEGLVAGEGLTMEQWQAGQAAWAARMGQVSPTDPILLQYGQLYQKWAPNHQAMMEASTQAILDDHNAQSGRGGGMSKELTLDNADEFFGHADIRVRARGVREMIRIWELNEDDRDPTMHGLTGRAYEEALRILGEGAGESGLQTVDGDVDGVDIHTWSAQLTGEQTEQGVVDLVHGSLKDLAGEAFLDAAQDEQARAAVQQAIERLRPRAAHVDGLFEGTTDETKRIQIRQMMDDLRETLSDLEETLEDWDHTGPEQAEADEPSEEAGMQLGSVGSTPAVQAPATVDDSPLAMLKGLPIIGDLLRMLGL